MRSAGRSLRAAPGLMTPVVAVAALWLVFGGTHVGLAAGPVRGRLVARLGELGFTVLFYIVAAAAFAALAIYYAAHRFDGPSGLALANSWLRWPLLFGIAIGLILMTHGLRDYARLPMALFGQTIRAPRGIERITRHPFFAGTVLFALAHALLAVHLVGAVFFGALALFAGAGAVHQDRKLLARRGGAYAEYMARTSAVPFAAVLGGRQRVAWSELSVGTLASGLALSLALRHWHAALLAGDGVWFVAVFLAGALFAGLNAWRRSRRAIAAIPSAELIASGTSSHELSNLGEHTRSGIERFAGRGLIATGIGHTVVGLFLFRQPLAAIFGDGVINAIGAGQFDRAAAFWFLLFSPICVALGQIVDQALERGDRRTLRIVGGNLLGIGIVGAAIMPISGFWLVIAIAPLVLQAARDFVPTAA